MKSIAGLCLALLALDLTTLRTGAAGAAAYSRSGQFLVRGQRTQAMISGPGLAAFPVRARIETNWVTLDPDLLAVSAERLKGALLRELNLLDRWQGKVFVDLHPTPADEQPPFLTSLYYPNGWQYHLDLPDRLESQKAARALVEVLLLEIANRNAGPRSAELPPWLIEGMTLCLVRSAQADLVLRPETDVVRQQIRPDPLAASREFLRTHHALTFTELSLPTAAQLTGEGWANYQACAQLLVIDLSHLRGGRAQLASLLLLAPEYLNWQTAFLRAFHPHFRSLLDVEKWWAVSVTDFCGRDQSLAWPTEKSMQKLDEILGVPVLVRYTADALPVTTNLPLQTIIGQWGFDYQRNLLMTKTNLLLALRPNLPAALIPLADGYRFTLATYLAKEEQPGVNASGRYQPSIRPQVLRRDAIQQLNLLDARREVLRRSFQGATNALTSPNSGPPKRLGQFP